MGFLKKALGVAAPFIGQAVGGPLGGMLGGALGGALTGGGPNSSTVSSQQRLDPRVDALLFGDGKDNKGLIDRYKGLLDTPQSYAANAWGQANSDFLNNYGVGGLSSIRDAATKAMGGSSAPTTTAAQASLPAYAVGNMVQAPSQNNIDLSNSYNRFINGKPGANPYLDQQIGGAIAQNRLGFQQMLDDSTKNLQQNVLPGIRSNSVLSGQYGGSRQGVAEGNAIGTQQTELARAAAQFGQNATNAAVGAKANAYETDSNRALAATQGLGAQQYGVASQNAHTRNQAEFMNVANMFDASRQNAAFQQQANLANQQSQLSTNGQNASSLLGGAGLLSGLFGQVGGNVNAYDNYGINRAQQVNGLLAPYMGVNGTQSTTTPLYNSTSGNILGGALAGLSMGNSLGSLFGGPSNTSLQTTGSAGNYSLAPSNLPVPSFGLMGSI